MTVVGEIHRQVKDYYGAKLAEHGQTHRGVDWNSRESQFLRFEQLLTLHRDREQSFSLLDYGCGVGSLADYLEQEGLNYDYTGYDISQAMVQAARERLDGNEKIAFTANSEELSVADYTVASGIFNVRLETPDSDWLGYIIKTIHGMWDLSNEGIAFNCLTSYSDKPFMRDDLYYANPCDLFDYCKRNLSKQVAILHDYGLYEFTMLVRKER